MVNQAARNSLRENRKTETLINGMKDTIVSMLQSKEKPANEEVLKLVVKREDESKLLEKMGKIGDALAMVYKAVTRPIVLPKIFDVKGKVEVVRNAPTRITNLSDLEKYFKSLESMLRTFAQAASMAPAPQIKIPDFPRIEIPKADNSKLEELIEELIEKIGKIKPVKTEFPREISISNFPQQYIPTPVTNISINPLQGVVKTTSTTVGTTLTQLPGYGQLNNRRALQIYNASSNTIHYGGSDVTTSNGIPVASGDFSNVIDAGYNMIVYGIAATTGNDIRVIEVSKDNSGTIQQ